MYLGRLAQRRSYTPNGVLETLTDGENNKTTYEYDGHDRLVRTYYPVPTKGANASSATDYEELGYDNRSNVISRRIPGGGMLYYGYDALSRLVAYDRIGSEPDVSYTYDNLSNLARAHDMYGHKAEFTYDALGNPCRGRQFLPAAATYDNVLYLTWPSAFELRIRAIVRLELGAKRTNVFARSHLLRRKA